jgi:glutaredoxin 3
MDVTDDDDKRRWLLDVTGSRTVPQIFFGDESIGGCRELEALVKQGALKKRLAAPSAL